MLNSSCEVDHFRVMSVISNEGSCGLDLVWVDFEGSLEKIISGFWMFHCRFLFGGYDY